MQKAQLWQTLSPSEVAAELNGRAGRIDARDARAIRDRAASCLLAEPSQAHEIALALRRAVQGIRNPEVEAHAFRCLAESRLYLGRLRASADAYDRACQHASELKHRGLLGSILVGRVHVLSALGRDKEAARSAKEAEEILVRTGATDDLAKLFVNRGNSHYQRERLAEAWSSYERAAELLDPGSATWVALQMNRGIVATNLGQITAAREVLVDAATWAEELELHSLLGRVQFNLSYLDRFRGDYQKALSRLRDARERLARDDVKDMIASVDRARAEAYLEAGAVHDAQRWAKQAATAFLVEDHRLDAMICRELEARAWLQQNSAREALSLIVAAISFYQRRRMRPRLAGAHQLAAQAEITAGQPKQARSHARAAITGFARLGLTRRSAEARIDLARASLALGREDEAESQLRPALRSASHLPKTAAQELWVLGGRIAAARGRTRLAVSRFRRAVETLESMRSLTPGLELRTRQFAHHAEAYTHLIEATLRGKRPSLNRILGLVEAGRARSFLDRSAGLGADARDAAAQSLATLGAWSRRIEKLELTPKLVPAQKRELEALRSRARSSEREIAERFSELHEREGTSEDAHETASVEAVSSVLQPHESVIEFYVMTDRILVIIVGHKAREWKILPASLTELRSHLERFRFQLESVGLHLGHKHWNGAFLADAARAILRDLYALLIEPFRDLLPSDGRLIFVPHRLLHSVPFECLHDESGPLDRRFEIARAPTASFVSTRPDRLVAHSGAWIGAGISSPSVHRELESVARQIGDTQKRLFRKATTIEIMTGLENARILHLIAHGVYREDNPSLSRIGTADGALFVADIMGRRIKTDLVTLSACETGVAFAGRGDDLAGVAHAFLAAGARWLVAGLWRVEDRATSALMENFYAHLDPLDIDPPSALRKAMQETRRDWAHPFFWGGFASLGA